jgi:hypothetical protein
MNDLYSDRSSDDENDNSGSRRKPTNRASGRVGGSNTRRKELPTPPQLNSKEKPAFSENVIQDNPLTDEYGFIWEKKEDMPPPTYVISSLQQICVLLLTNAFTSVGI